MPSPTVPTVRSPRRARVLAGLALAAALTLTACGSSGGNADSEPPADAPGDAPRVVDLLDTTFDLARLGIPVVANGYLDPSFVESQLAEVDLPPDVAEAVRAAPSVNTGDGIDTEAVAAADPDIILLTQTSIETFQADREALEEFADVVLLPEDLTWQERTVAIGEAVDRQAEAEELVSQAEQSIETLGSTVQEAGVAGSTVSPMRLDVPDFGALALIPPSIASTTIADAGLTQPEPQLADPPPYPGVADYYALTEVAIERLPEHDGDVILALARGGAGATSAVDGNPLWEQMSAVQADRVVEVPYLLWALNSATGVEQITEDLTEVVGILEQR